MLLSCGADNTGPLSWSSLVDLDLSYNDITELNESLVLNLALLSSFVVYCVVCFWSQKLCLSVQTLDLSHNQIVCDETGLQVLAVWTLSNEKPCTVAVLPTLYVMPLLE